MILIVPILTSGSVSANVLPGIMKAVEKYTIIYGMDSILKSANALFSKSVELAGATMQMASGKLRIKEGSLPLFSEQGGVPGPQGNMQFQMGTATGPTKPTGGQQQGTTGQAVTKALGKQISEPKKGSSVIVPGDYNALSLEPTWVQVSTTKSGLQLLGIKAIPFPVQSPENLINHLLYDRASKSVDYLTKKYSRMMIRIMFRVARKIRIPMLKDRVLTGDPKTDILWASSMYKDNLIVVFNQMELEQADIFSSPRTVNRLHKLGWSSFILADDVNKRATFCMKEFGGVCSTVMYSYLFSSLGASHNKVYEDLEDIRRSSSPIFRMSTSKKRVFGETFAQAKLNDYSLDPEPLLEQEIDTFAKKMTNPITLGKTLKKATSAIASNNPQELQTALKDVPRVPVPKVLDFCRKYSAQFNSNFELSKRVIKNSTDFSDNLTKYSACILAMGAVTQNPSDPDFQTKRNLKMYIGGVRKFSVEEGIKSVAQLLMMAAIVAIAQAANVAISTTKILGTGWEFLKKALLATPKPVKIGIVIAILLIFLVWISKES